MEKDYFLNSNLQPSQLLDHQTGTWNSFSAAQQLNFSETQQQMDCFINPTWTDSINNINHFDSSLSSVVSSQPTTTSNGFILREFIGKLGSVSHSNEPIHQVMDTQLTNSNNCGGLRNPTLPSLVSDPGFAERAAKFSCFGSRSFNGRSSQLNHRSSAPLAKLPRVGSLPDIKNSCGLVLNSDQNLRRFANSSGNSNENGNSSVSEQGVSGETEQLNSRKRKAVSRGKLKEDFEPLNVDKVEEDVNAKRLKQAKKEEEEAKATNSNSEEEKQNQEKGNQKPPEPPKDYIHVRARRGQATDSHSLAERVRREKISERMKLLQDLVPGCNKVTGKSLMLVEIINYVQALQRQVEFLSMKLSSVNERMDVDAENLISKEMYQPNTYFAQPMYPLDSLSVAAFYGHHPQQVPPQQTNNRSSDVTISQSSTDPLDGNTLNHCLMMQLPPVGGVVEGLHQFSALCEDDLQSIVQMGFNQNTERERPFHSQGLLAPIEDSDTKIEL